MQKTAIGPGLLLSQMQQLLRSGTITKTFLVMRLTMILLIVSFFSAHATGTAQTVSISGKDLTLKEVFTTIERQTGYVLFSKKEMLEDAKRVSISVENQPLQKVLDLVLKGTPFKYAIRGKTIILSRESNTKEPAKELDAIEQFLSEAFFPVNLVVTDAEGTALFGATVLNKRTKVTVMTDKSGAATVEAIAGDVLTISFIGYESQNLTIAGQTSSRSIKLKRTESQMDEVVISTGYSSKKIGEMTGAAQKVSGDDLRRGITSADPASLLKGRTTGLYISDQAGGDPTNSGGQIFVRGQSSIAGVGVDQVNEFVMPALNYGPLLVMDGVIMPNQNLRDLVTPQEIQDITILKDAAATAIYGSRAAAGVLVVTTKKGRSAVPRLTAEVKYGINKPNQGTIRFLNGRELYNVQKQFYTEDYRINNGSLSGNYPTLDSYLNFRLPTEADVANSYDWSKYAFNTTNTFEVNVAASGGNDRTKYYAGGTYYNEQSTGVQNALVRKSFRLNLDSRLTDRLSVNLAINGIINNGKRDPDRNIGFLYGLIPWANPYNSDGSLKQALSYKLDGFDNETDNPLFNQQYNSSKIQSQLFFGSAKLEYRITDWLSFSSTNSGNLNYNKSEVYLDVRTYTGGTYLFAPKGFLGTNTTHVNNYLTSNQLSFRKQYGAHSLRAIGAMEYGETQMENMTVNVNNVRAGYPIISLARQVGARYDYSSFGIPASKTGNIEGGKDVKAIFSAFGELGYTYNDRYSLSASLRTDASSSFGPDQRYGTFYSAGAAWIISKENFMRNVRAIHNLKLRGSYGTSGSQLGDNFLTRTLYDTRYNYMEDGGAIISVLGNPSLKWEVTKTFNAGLDIGLFKKVDATIDFYNRRSQDLLQKVTLPPAYGFPTQWQNVAAVQNQGIEVLINSQNITRKNFQWTTSFNFSYNRNKIISVANDSLAQGWGSGTYYLFPGDDINSLKAVKYAGVDPQTGKPLFEKLIFDDKGVQTGVQYVNTLAEVDAATDSRQNQYMGSFQPRFYGGVSNTFTYKQFSLSVLITYAFKYSMKDELASYAQGANVSSTNQIAYRGHQKVWTTPGQTDATEPSVYYQGITEYRGSSKYIHDASNAALRNVRISYDLPTSLLSRIKLAACSFYLSGDNLYTVYSRKIVASSPEGPSVGEGQQFGDSSGDLGIPRRFLVGVQLTF